MLPFAKYKNKTTYANFVRTILPSWVTKCKAGGRLEVEKEKI